MRNGWLWLAVLSLFVLTVVFMVVFASDNGASTSKANVRFDETETETLAHWQLLPMKMGRVRVQWRQHEQGKCSIR
jgi:hypothetical protein